jgi:hypothetical protein
MQSDYCNALANEAQANASRQVFERCNALLGEVRAYIEAGDTSKPFAATDLNEKGELATPLTYAADMEAFDAAAAAADVVEPVAAEEPATDETAEEESAPEESAGEEAAEAAAPQPLSGNNFALFGFLAAFAALIGWSKMQQ